MRDRQKRLRAIKRIIREQKIESQERLLHYLQEDGFTVTQATLSRDLKLLKVGKQAEGNEGYFYTLPSEEVRRERERSYAEDLLRGYISLDFTGPLAIVKTLLGHADSVAVAIDNLGVPEVLGTVAGDDTVMIALRENSTRDQFLEHLRERVPDFQD